VLLLAEAALGDIPKDSPVRADVEGILNSARHAKEIVAKVLLFTRAQGVRELELIELEPVVYEAIRLFGLLVPPSVMVKVDLNGPYPTVRGDPALALQLIMNLCTNGYQAMIGEEGTLTVRLTVEAGDSSKGADTESKYLVLSVSDTGHGMSAETLERIFEPFFTTREIGRGSGLGLAVVHGIAESFGASIRVDSKVGQGTTFKVYFPIVRHEAAVAAAPDASSGART
jgi:signal transduction histidine kinase